MEGMNIASGSSSIRRRSLSISSHMSHHTDNDGGECESVSEAGDIGDRALPSRRFSESGSFRLSFDNKSENNGAIVRPLPIELSSTTPLSTDAILVCSEDSNHVS